MTHTVEVECPEVKADEEMEQLDGQDEGNAGKSSVDPDAKLSTQTEDNPTTEESKPESPVKVKVDACKEHLDEMQTGPCGSWKYQPWKRIRRSADGPGLDLTKTVLIRSLLGRHQDPVAIACTGSSSVYNRWEASAYTGRRGCFFTNGETEAVLECNTPCRTMTSPRCKKFSINRLLELSDDDDDDNDDDDDDEECNRYHHEYHDQKSHVEEQKERKEEGRGIAYASQHPTNIPG